MFIFAQSLTLNLIIMRKVLFIVVSLMILSVLFIGCKKSSSNDDVVQPTPPTPTPPVETAVIKYYLGNQKDEIVMSPCFRANLTYRNADGEMLSVENVSLPWTSEEITVTKPFDALMEGVMLFNEEELPDTVVYGRMPSLYIDGELVGLSFGNVNMWSKENFLRMVTEHPDRLNFNYSRSVN